MLLLIEVNKAGSVGFANSSSFSIFYFKKLNFEPTYSDLEYYKLFLSVKTNTEQRKKLPSLGVRA
jgi:hypothetical protein